MKFILPCRSKKILVGLKGRIDCIPNLWFGECEAELRGTGILKFFNNVIRLEGAKQELSQRDLSEARYVWI